MRGTASVATLALVLAACSGASDSSTTTPGQTGGSTTTGGAEATTTTAAAQGPDLILHNAQVITVDAEFSIAEAVAIADGDIVAVGSSTEITPTAGSNTLLIDLDGLTITPGFIDPHTHHMQGVAPDLDAMLAGQAYMLEGGTTTSGAPHVTPEHIEAFEALESDGDLVMRTHLYAAYNDFCNGRDLQQTYLDHEFSQDPDLKLTVAGVKLFGDGGACRAPAISDGYLASTPDSLKERGFVGNGDLYTSRSEITKVVLAVDAAGGITVIHAIGDLAIGEALEGLQIAYEAAPFTHQQRIDHNSFTSLLTPEQLVIYGQVGMVPVVFPVPWGEGCDFGLADMWQSVLPGPHYDAVENSAALRAANPDTLVSWHGDAPSIPGQALQLMFTLVTGGAVDIETGEPCYPPAWNGFHTVDVEEAFRMTTINAATAMEIESRVGSIEPGKVADLLILAEDPLGTDAETGIATNRPLVTMIDGEVAYCDEDMCPVFAGAMPVAEEEPSGDQEPADGSLIAAVTASNSIQPPTNAVDGSEDTSWASGGFPPQWIELELAQPTLVATLRLKVDQSPAGFTAHEVFAGDHSNPGRYFGNIDGDTDWGDWLEFGIGETVRFIRIVTIDSPSWVSWLEIEVIEAG